MRQAIAISRERTYGRLPHVEQMDLISDSAAPVSGTQLGFTMAGARLRELDKERDLLLRKVAAARATHEQLLGDVRFCATGLADQLQPILDQCRRLDQEIHALFRGILDDPRRGKRTRREVQEVYESLQGQGIITDAAEAEEQRSGPPDPDGSGARSGQASPFTPASAPESATRPTDKGALRALFRRLAEALHPDKTQDEQDRHARTETMKQVTVAYHDGDYARLLEIQKAAADGLLRGGADADDLEQQCEAALQCNQELRAQLKTTKRESRDLRRSPDYRLAKELKRPGGKQAVLAQSQGELENLRTLRDFVHSFRDGKLSIEDFLAGSDPQDPEDVVDLVESALADIASILGGGPPIAARRPRDGRRAR